MHASINGTELYVERHGNGIPILVMHGGLGLDHTYFRPWLDHLGDCAELIYYDHRGNGRSARTASLSAVDHATFAADAEQLRARLGLDRFILLGHSYGGFLAQEYALRYGGEGSALAGLVLCSTAPALDYAPVTMANALARGKPDELAALGEAFGRAMESDEDLRAVWMRLLPLYFKQYDEQIGRAVDQATIYSAAAWNHANANCLPTFSTVARLAEITVPTLVLGGSDDWITPPEQGRRLQASIADAELAMFEQSGHFPFIEEPDKFIATVSGWLGRLSAADCG
ncbi:MAG: alpha/beta fold hydrolase [Betaproteobacteria bacterium]|nr:alpha/beta fold hydrolase [Betaproteobacteria bacterium]